MQGVASALSCVAGLVAVLRGTSQLMQVHVAPSTFHSPQPSRPPAPPFALISSPSLIDSSHSWITSVLVGSSDFIEHGRCLSMLLGSHMRRSAMHSDE
jgi:hypothetical protein